MGAVALADVVNRAIDGDDHAFAALYRAHADAAYRLLTRLVGPIAERDDLLQETFVRLHRVLPRFEHRSSLATFIHRIAVRVAIDHLRMQRRRPVTVEAVDDQMASLAVSSAVRAEVADALRNLSTLSPEQRVAFVLREVMDYSFPEIAQLVGCFTTTARMRVAAAKRALARRSR